jgi:hypothetical protein
LIYFIRAVSGKGAIKIGTTARLTARLKQLERKHGVSLQVLGVLDGRYAEEHALHVKFAHLLQRDEWFGAHPDLTDFIATETRPWDGEDDAPRLVTVVVKGRDEWKEWLEEAATNCRLSVSAFLDQALACYARDRGIQEEPPKR